MEVITLKSWDEYDKAVSRKHYRKWIYRGQLDSSWKLESSLHRAFEEAQAIHKAFAKTEKRMNRLEHERVMIDRFMCNAHIYLSSLPKEADRLSWLSLMQHHGAPTRLLDFTFSPYIALFFALEAGQGSAAVYCVNHHAIKNDDDEYFGKNRLEVYSRVLEDENASDDPFLFSFEPTFSNHRLLSQQGLFVATNTLKYSHEETVKDYQIGNPDMVKYIIPKKLRYSGLKKLNQMNINAANIYPGLDGFCKTMRRQPLFGLEWQRRVGNES